ncbi:MAG: hypothetical protein IT362_04790 [Deltaproteobacteria bacterium]|nr:hypothetical protein [Deltaproteobacteria bacterium]
MSTDTIKRRALKLCAQVLLIFTAVLLSSPPSSAQERLINGGPYSLTIRGGAQGDSPGIGIDARADYINPLLNLHLFGTYDLLDASSQIGDIDSQRFGAGLAVSHTYQRKANVYAGTSMINELGEYFGHVYVGGKVKASDNILFTGSYGLGISNQKAVTKTLARFTTAEAANWMRLGFTLVEPTGLKASLNYYITDPTGLDISGVDGAISYPVTDFVTLGVNASVDIRTRSDIDRNWNSYAFMTYSFGARTGTPFEVALDRNSPAVYPVILRTLTPGSTSPASTLAISPESTSIFGCSYPYTGGTATFTASGGTAPYSWSSSIPGGLNIISSTQAEWTDSGDDFCSSSGSVTVTVTDYDGATATGTVNISVE